MKYKKILLVILLLTLFSRLIFAFGSQEVLWDSGVYTGMGKYIFSGGEIGLWEELRPVGMSFVLGFFWFLGLNPLLFGMMFTILLMLGVVYLTYMLGREWFDERVALFASLFIAFSSIFYYLSFHQYTEIPAVFFVLFSLFLFTKKKYVWAGAIAGVAFYFKFPAGLVIIALGMVLLFSKNYKELFRTMIAFTLTVLPYFIWSWITYGNPFATLLAGKEAILLVAGCNLLRTQPFWQYFIWILGESVFHLFAIPGAFIVYKQRKKKHLLFVLSLLFPLIYFMQLNCRDYRYLTLFLPFVAMLSAIGLVYVYERGRKTQNKTFFVLLLIIGVLLFSNAYTYYSSSQHMPSEIEKGYYDYLSNNVVEGEIWSSHPLLSVYSDTKIEKIYYPVYNTELATQFYDYVEQNNQEIGAVFLDNCGGGIICGEDVICEEKTEALIALLDEKFERVYDEKQGSCWWLVWQ